MPTTLAPCVVATAPQETSSSHELQGNAKRHRGPQQGTPVQAIRAWPAGPCTRHSQEAHLKRFKTRHTCGPIPTCHTSMHTFSLVRQCAPTLIGCNARHIQHTRHRAHIQAVDTACHCLGMDWAYPPGGGAAHPRAAQSLEPEHFDGGTDLICPSRSSERRTTAKPLLPLTSHLFFVSRALVGVQPSVASKEGDEEEELYRTIHGHKVKRELSDDEPHEEVQQWRTRSHDESSKRLTE